MAYKFVKAVPAPSGRMAVLARLSEASPWVQIESTWGDDNDLLDEIENDDPKRAEYIQTMGRPDNLDWGDDGVPLT